MKQKDKIGAPADLQWRSLWSQTAPEPCVFAPLMGPLDTEVVIVGGGIAGLSTALHLAENGISVVVLEGRQPGAGASGQSGGQVIPGLRHFRSDLIKAYGQDLGLRAHAFGSAAADIVFDLIARRAITCDAVRQGWVQAADSPAALAQSESRVAEWRAGGAPVRMLDERQIRDLVGASDYIGGWMDERGGTVQPLAYTQGLALAAKKAGAIIHGDSPAIAMRRVGAAWRVSTPAGEVTAPKLLLAINAMGGDLLPALNRMVMPVWSYQIATAPLSSAERAGVLPTQVAASDTRRVLRYFRLDREHRLVVGGKGKSHAPRSPADFDFQRATLHRLYPALAGVPIDFRWGGQVAVTPDRLPRAVSLGPQAFANLGCNGKGIAWCTAMGQAFAESFATGSTGCLPIPVTPVRPIPLHQLRRLYVGAGSAWLRFRDRLDHSSNVTNSSQGAST